MLHLSISELLDIWGELVEAHCGKNGYGGDTAELYAYRFMRHTPGAVTGSAAREEQKREAALSLWGVLRFFSLRHECTLVVEGRPFGSWVKAINFDHRVHVRVVHREGVAAAAATS